MTRGHRIAALALAALIAVVAFVALRPEDEASKTADRRATAGTARTTDAEKPSQRPEAKAAPAYSTIRLRGGEPVGEPQLEQGDMARIEVRSDQPGELHIHGYDKYLNLKADKPARTRFKANLEGIFEIENHDTTAQIAELRVNP
ncbi:MAG: hypothetical protein M3R46_14530 [Actinomycetota bacterium]|nr:hypothetical protein [Actinomycetota bacterium]